MAWKGHGKGEMPRAQHVYAAAAAAAACAHTPSCPPPHMTPGTGNLTRHLLGAGVLLTAVEKDYTLSDTLGEEFNGVSGRAGCGVGSGSVQVDPSPLSPLRLSG